MKIHIVSHTHWDREWYRPFQYFKVKLSYFFDKLFSIIEKDDSYAHFMLDGQMVMIEDYLNLKPQQKQKIKELVAEGRLIIGPWYSQPDEFAPSDESLVRNLLVGTNMADEFGNCMKVGYLPDSFGQSCQMPQILRGSGIESACIMRGVPAHKLNRTEFIWQGLNGDEVLTVALPKGYSNGMHLPKPIPAIDMRAAKLIQDLKEFGNKENVLFLDGVDHQLPQSQTADYIKAKKDDKHEYVHSTLEDYIKDAFESRDELVNLQGELISPVTNRVHTSIASSRMYQKTKNRQMETLLCNSVEPLCTLSNVMGADYPKDIINSAWKEMFKNQAHDSICGCCTDEVHKEIDQRFSDVENMGITLKKMHSRSVASVIAEDDELVLAIFNDSMTKGKQIVNATVYTDSEFFALVDEDGNEISYDIDSTERIDAASLSIWSLYLETPCMVNKVDISFELDFDFNYGYKKLVIKQGQKPENETKCQEAMQKKMENDFSVVTFNSDGTFNLLDKHSNKEYFNLNTIEDCGDAGDTYNYSPVENDKVITSKSVKQCKVEIKQYLNKSTALIQYELQVPEGLSIDGKSRSDATVCLNIETEITLHNSLKRIDIKTKILNEAKDHRIRAIFPTGIKSDYSYAQTQYGTIRRNNVIEDENLWKVEKWAEKPLPIYSNHKFVDVNNGSEGLAILNRGLTEYEIYHQDECEIAITLLRGVGYMGKPDLAVRPGRPSGVNVATPDAQCLGEYVFEYSVLAHTGNTDGAKIAKHAAMYNAAPTAAQNVVRLNEIVHKFSDMLKLFDVERLQDRAQKKMDAIKQGDYEFINIDDDRLIISALKKAEDDEAIMLRVYNSTQTPIKDAQICINGSIAKVYECDLMEKNTLEIAHKEQIFDCSVIKGYTAQTYRIILE